mmetsp:Transcript_12949/g.21911  ORF Transcript_12949/g.21911 Transcript_12949/m.21911 type:complete len:93 (+) Transcript_12949:81-359(+)
MEQFLIRQLVQHHLYYLIITRLILHVREDYEAEFIVHLELLHLYYVIVLLLFDHLHVVLKKVVPVEDQLREWQFCTVILRLERRHHGVKVDD